MNILVVDDERDVQDLFEQRFRKEIKEGTIKLVFAFSGDDALLYMENHPHEEVLILSDINMPGMNGIDLLKKIKKKYEQPPPIVVMITAYGDQEIYNLAMKFGADGFLTKPVDFSSLKEKLKSFLI